jgi:carbamoyl-phosphate synthase large subunit
VLVEESLLGWDEFEPRSATATTTWSSSARSRTSTDGRPPATRYRRAADDALRRGVQELRDAAAAIIRAVGVECGGSNIQFARDRERRGARDRDEPPRLALVGAGSRGDRLPDRQGGGEAAVGYTLDEIPNDLTGTTPAS